MPKGSIFKSTYLSFFGILFFVFGISALIRTVLVGNPLGILWLCYSALILIGVGMFFNNGKLILIQLNILLIPDLIWTLDFFSFWIFDYDLFGATGYFFYDGLNLFAQILSLQHLVLIPIALLGLYFIKIERDFENTWFWSWIQTATLFGLTYIFGSFWSVEYNVNCAFTPCLKFFGPNLYPYTLMILFACMILITDLILRNLKIFNK